MTTSIKDTKTPAYVSISLTMLFWSMSYIWIKIVYQCFNPTATVFLRLLMAAPLTYFLARLMKRLQPVEKKDKKYLVFLSLLQPFLFYLTESYGLKFVSPTVGAVIITTIPLFTPLAAYYFLKERLSPLNIVGLLVSFIGVLLVVLKGDFTLAASPLGLLLFALAVASGVAYTTSLKRVSGKYHALTIVTYQNFFGLLWFFPLFLLTDLGHTLNSEPTLNVLVSLGLLALLPSTLGFILFAYSVKELGASRASMFGNMLPAFTALFAWLVLDELITLRMIIGISIVILGLFAAQMKKW